jgi:hypothetical protein
LLTAQEEESAAADALVGKIEVAGVVRVALMQGQLEIRVLRYRWPELKQPPVPEILELQDVLPPVLKAARTTPLGPKGLRIVHTAGKTAAERRREVLKQLTEWLARRKGSLSAEAQAIFDAVGVPEWMTQEEKDRDMEREAKATADEAVFHSKVSAHPVEERRAL